MKGKPVGINKTATYGGTLGCIVLKTVISTLKSNLGSIFANETITSLTSANLYLPPLEYRLVTR